MKNLLLVFHNLLIFSIVGCDAKPKVVYVREKKDGERHGQKRQSFFLMALGM